MAAGNATAMRTGHSRIGLTAKTDRISFQMYRISIRPSWSVVPDLGRGGGAKPVPRAASGLWKSL
jgi:hypothetical protein